MQDTARGEKWIGHARLLAEIPSTSIEYCEMHKILSRVGFPWVAGSPGPGSPGPLFLPPHVDNQMHFQQHNMFAQDEYEANISKCPQFSCLDISHYITAAIDINSCPNKVPTTFYLDISQ